MADLFESSTDNIGLHLKNIYAAGELSEPATTGDYSVVQTEGKRQVKRNVRRAVEGALGRLRKMLNEGE
jgi:hypothetical protein